MYNIKNLSKRGLALFLTLVMCLGMLNLTAFATDGSKLGTVVKGAFVADQEEMELPTEFTEGAANTVSTPGGKVSVTKTAEAVECEDGNQFKVTLEVVTEDKISESIVTPDAAVTLVIDVSGSMKFCAKCGDDDCEHLLPLGHEFNDDGHGWSQTGKGDNKCDANVNKDWWDYQACGKTEAEHKGQTRLDAAKVSAKDFLDSLKENTPANSDGTTPARYVSVVTFSTSASQQCEWKDIMTKDGYDAVLKAINDLSANGGTRPDLGLDEANKLMQDGKVSKTDKANRFTVLLTDGQPDQNGHKTSTLCSYAKTSAGTLKQNSNAIYSVYYGDASDTCYGKVTIRDFLKSFSNSVYSASDAGQLTSSFESISRTIALLTKAWEVTDPMGSDVHFMEVTSNQGTSVDCKDGALTWKLREDTPVTKTVSGQPVYTYTLTYRVSVDSAAEDFDVEAIHPLNGYTSLSYGFYKDGNLVDEDGNAKEDQTKLDTIGFNVPGVIVQRPERPWKIEYYQKQKEDGSYALVDTAIKGDAKVWDKVSLAVEDPNYKTRYDNAGYQWSSYKNDVLTINANPDLNVIKVYYDPIPAEVTVNHYYKVVTIKADGTTETRDWPKEPDLTIYKPDKDKNEALYVGDSFTAEEITTWGSISGFEFDHTEGQPRTINKLAKTNVINLYYVKTIDERADASVVVDHVYTTHTWTLVDGKYQLVDTETTAPNMQHETGLRAYDSYTADSTLRKEGFGDYTAVSGNQYAIEELAAGDNNKITLYFEKTVDNRGDELHLTVQHRYTKTVTKIVDGKVVTTVSPDHEVGRTDNITFYNGETVTVEKQRVYEGDTYENPGEDSVTLPNPKDGMVYVLDYTLVDAPELTTVTVRHIYKTAKYETITIYKTVEKEVTNYVPVTNADGSPVLDADGEPVMEAVTETVTEQVPVGTEERRDLVEDERTENTVEGRYVGESYTAGIEGREHYKCMTSDADRTKTVQENGATVIEIEYLRDSRDENWDMATIDVVHRYTTHLKTIVGGEVKTIDVPSGTVQIAYEPLEIGDSFTAELQKIGPDGEEYTVVGEPDLTRVLKAGDNSTIEIEYERDDEDLVAAAGYQANYVYKTYTMSVDPATGVADYYDEPSVENGESVTNGEEPVYVGQIIQLPDGAKEGFTPGNNPAASQTLTDGSNEWTFVWEKYVPLPQVKVVVNHYLTTKTITLDGETENTELLRTEGATKHVGESYTASADTGFAEKLVKVEVDGTAYGTETSVALESLSADVVVDFYYEITDDQLIPVSYTIQHIYYTYNWDGTEIEAQRIVSEPETRGSFAGMNVSASIVLPENAGYELTKATLNDESVSVDASGTYSFPVSDSDAVVFVYERHIDTRPLTSAQIVHEYYASQDALENGEMEGRDLVNIPDLRVGETIQAELRTSNGGRTYAMANASALSITVVENKEQNVITIQYIRATTTYQVIHEYYTNGELTGSTSSTLAGNAGDTITAESIAKETTYGGNTYTYTRASGDPLTLVQGENGAIILRYDRSTGGGTPTPTPTPDDDDDDDDPPAPPTPEDETTPEEEVPEEEVPLVDTPEEEIPDEEIPMIQEPKTPEEEEEEILDEDVPLSVVPQTGDGSGLWFNMGLVSALGLALLRFFRKREE